MWYRVLVLGLVTAVLAVFLGLTGATAQDRDRADKGTGTKEGVGKGTTYQGKILRVDADKRMLVLRDVRGSGTGGTGGTTDKGTGGGRDKGTTDKGTTDKGTTGTTDKGTTGGRDKGTGRDTGTADKGTTGRDKGGETGTGMLSFRVGREARITLDGRKAELADLKAGFMARVEVSGAGGTGGTGGTTDKGTGGDRDKGTTDKGTSGGRDKGTTDKGTTGTTDKGTTGGRDKGTTGTADKGGLTDKGPGGTTGRVLTAVRIEAFSKGSDLPGGGTGKSGGTGSDKP